MRLPMLLRKAQEITVGVLDEKLSLPDEFAADSVRDHPRLPKQRNARLLQSAQNRLQLFHAYLKVHPPAERIVKDPRFLVTIDLLQHDLGFAER